MSKLTENDIIKMLDEEYDRHLNKLYELRNQYENNELVVDIGLRLRHKKTGFVYTIADVNDTEIAMTTPDGSIVKYDINAMGKEFVVD